MCGAGKRVWRITGQLPHRWSTRIRNPGTRTKGSSAVISEAKEHVEISKRLPWPAVVIQESSASFRQVQQTALAQGLTQAIELIRYIFPNKIVAPYRNSWSRYSWVFWVMCSSSYEGYQFAVFLDLWPSRCRLFCRRHLDHQVQGYRWIQASLRCQRELVYLELWVNFSSSREVYPLLCTSVS